MATFQDQIYCSYKKHFLPESMFSKNARRCKSCDSEYKKIWSLENKEIIAAKRKQYSIENKQRIKSYKEDNKEKLSIQNKEWRRNNPDKVRVSKKRDYIKNKSRYNKSAHHYYELHKEKVKQYIKEWRDQNYDKVKAYSNNYHSLKKQSGVKINSGEVLSLLKQQNSKCFYCDEKLDGYHIEHIMPLSKGGEHKLYNIVLACPACNHKKYNKDPEHFVNEILKVG